MTFQNNQEDISENLYFYLTKQKQDRYNLSCFYSTLNSADK